jgi:hypothetical protein
MVLMENTHNGDQKAFIRMILALLTIVMIIAAIDIALWTYVQKSEMSAIPTLGSSPRNAVETHGYSEQQKAWLLASLSPPLTPPLSETAAAQRLAELQSLEAAASGSTSYDQKMQLLESLANNQ